LRLYAGELTPQHHPGAMELSAVSSMKQAITNA
jgi:hypothetical protein